MNPLDKISNLPSTVKYLNAEYCEISFTIHQADIQAFKFLFDSFSHLFKTLAYQAKTNVDAIHARILSNQFKTQTYAEEYEIAVCEMFNDFLNENDPRTSFSLTVSTIKDDYPGSSFDQVKHILIKHKKLKNTGFYKIRTH